ncbi:DNA polymerase III subunit delta' [Shouchella lehensis]|uniref:DNA polymerase III subunit delta' n=2 Tax=Shouchella lehensis TaxID=300825 RepID=A0A060M2E5_9BACI|nr:DNA polymerase III subunit delta' [Shouchella lehensis]AIC96577.1 DNA polymerase III subunit delta' [Shouchella lehensis G1]MBG9782412.1 DNA polymerase III subunit delta' [Shouchella lehensis]
MNNWNDWKEAQPQVVPMLVESIKKQRLAHAYLFEGQAGSGTMDLAILLSKSFICQNKQGPNPCLTCLDCTRIDSGNHPDLHKIAPDGQSIKREQVDYLQKEFSYRGVESRQKVYIVSNADKMTGTAANTLLKFLEEPQGETLAILLTEQAENVLPTIRSRTQHIRFHPPLKEEIVKQLMENGIDQKHSSFLAELTENKEAALRLTEDDWSFQARGVVLQLMHELYTRPDQAIITLAEKWLPLMKERIHQEMGLEMMTLWLRDLLYIRVGKQGELVYSDFYDSYKELSLSTSQRLITLSLAKVMEAKSQLSANVAVQLVMERLLFTIQEG